MTATTIVNDNGNDDVNENEKNNVDDTNHSNIDKNDIVVTMDHVQVQHTHQDVKTKHVYSMESRKGRYLGQLGWANSMGSSQKASLIDERDEHHTLPVVAFPFHVHPEICGIEVVNGRVGVSHQPLQPK